MPDGMQTITRSSAPPNAGLDPEAGVLRSRRNTRVAPRAPAGLPQRRALAPPLLLVAHSVVSQQPIFRRRLLVLVALFGAVATGPLRKSNVAGAATRRITMACVFLISFVRHVLAVDLAETTIYGNIFESRSMIAYAEVRINVFVVILSKLTSMSSGLYVTFEVAEPVVVTSMRNRTVESIT